MGVYVKGVKHMPENCAMCPLCHRNFDGNETRLACYGVKKWCDENIDRLDDCPLVEVPEPHGRLIDADEITAFLEIERNDKNVESLDEFPTVIDAEGE